MKAYFAVGRFQPPTIGHAALIETLATLAQKEGADAFVFVSSTQGTGKEKLKNPLTSDEKTLFLQKMFPEGVTFVDTAKCDPKCGGPYAAYFNLLNRGYTDITLVAGSDREADFGPSSRLWNSLQEVPPPKFYPVGRDADDDSNSLDPSVMSGTKARGFALAGDYDSFSKALTRGLVTDDDVRDLYSKIRGRLLKGGRRTYKRRMNKRRRTKTYRR